MCVFCQRRKAFKNAYLAEKYLGVCTDCGEFPERVPKGGVFSARGNISTLFAPFYYKGHIKSAVKRYKFNGQQRYARIFVMLMYEYLKEFELHRNFELLTCVPLSRKRLYERGFCQTELLARDIGAKLSIPFEANCIVKTVHNRAQSATKNKYMRIENVKNVYLADGYKLYGKNILLLDDVYTTGATMDSCAEELLKNGAKSVSGIVFAKK